MPFAKFYQGLIAGIIKKQGTVSRYDLPLPLYLRLN